MPLKPSEDPTDLPAGATIRRPDPGAPFVAMSNRKRWSRCALSAVLPQLRTPSGPKAQEGTEAHKVAEQALQELFAPGAPCVDPTAVVPPAGLDDFDYSDAGVAAWRQMVAEHAYTYAQNASQLFSDYPDSTECYVEHKIEDVMLHGVLVFTVADVLLWNSRASRLVVGDYKFGRGPVGVGTADAPNEQCAGAAVLWAAQRRAAGARSPAEVGLFVYQPRTLQGAPWQVLAPLGQDWLAAQWARLDKELAAVAHAAAELAAGRLVEAQPGDHCKHCPSARWCPAAAAYGAAALDMEAGRRQMVDLTPEEVMALWSMRKAFEEFREDLGERVRILFEQRHPAVQVSRRAGNRIWANPSAAVEALMLADRCDLLQPPSLTRAEGALSAADLAALTTRAPDVVTYRAVSGPDAAAARNAFAQYLLGDKA